MKGTNKEALVLPEGCLKALRNCIVCMCIYPENPVINYRNFCKSLYNVYSLNFTHHLSWLKGNLGLTHSLLIIKKMLCHKNTAYSTDLAYFATLPVLTYVFISYGVALGFSFRYF